MPLKAALGRRSGFRRVRHHSGRLRRPQGVGLGNGNLVRQFYGRSDASRKSRRVRTPAMARAHIRARVGRQGRVRLWRGCEQVLDLIGVKSASRHHDYHVETGNDRDALAARTIGFEIDGRVAGIEPHPIAVIDARLDVLTWLEVISAWAGSSAGTIRCLSSQRPIVQPQIAEFRHVARLKLKIAPAVGNIRSVSVGQETLVMPSGAKSSDPGQNRMRCRRSFWSTRRKPLPNCRRNS